MESLRVNGVYELVDRLAGKKVVKSKWVLRVKANERGEVEKYKARVVAKGFSQVEGVDYDQNFSPTVRFESIRQMVALGTSKGHVDAADGRHHRLPLCPSRRRSVYGATIGDHKEGRGGEGDAAVEVPIWAEASTPRVEPLH